MDDKKCVELLNLGISEKRNGNYDKAISYYDKAKFVILKNNCTNSTFMQETNIALS